MRFEYPNKPTSNKLTPSGSSYSCLTAGFYPVGALNTWHGGIHIEGESVPLYAIADGEIIAYKISSKYLEDKILKGNEEQTAFYSDSFVLIRHKYEYDEGKVFTFYSLYNHLQIKEEITKEACPVFLSRHRTIKSAKQCLRVGANLRDANDTKKVLGVIPCGTAVDVLSKDGKMFEVETFSLWRKTSSVSNSITYELKCDKTVGKCYNRANQFDGIVFKEGIVIRKDILSKEDTFGVEGCVLYEDIGNKPMGILTKNMEVEIIEKSSEKKQWFKVKASELWIESEESTDSKIIYEKTPGEFEGWCENLNGQFDDYLEPEYDTIQSVSIPVNTENAIGYSGKYGSADGQALKNYHAAHVEVFSNDDVPAFLQAMLKKVTLDNKVYYKEKRETFFSIGKTIESYEYTKGKASEENISPYDWRAFGFRIFDGDPHGYFMSSDTPLLQEILGIVDTNLDGELSEKEFDDVRCNKAVNAHLSKMICVHRSEWTYRDDGLAKLKDEAGLVLDGCIKKANPKSSKEKQAYLDLKEEYVNRFEKKAKNLSFLYGISFPKMFSLLPDFCFYYFHPFAFVEQMRRMDEVCPYCGKKHVDLRSKMTFKNQGSGNYNCKNVCDEILYGHIGYKSEGAGFTFQNNAKAAYYQLALEDSTHQSLVFYADKISTGMTYMDLALNKGFSIVVGVNHTFMNDKPKDSQDHNEQTTDHFVVIVGRYCENDVIYYRFWDVGTQYGESDDYKFILTKDSHLVCDATYRKDGHSYTVTQVRRLIDDKNKIVTLTDLQLMDSKI